MGYTHYWSKQETKPTEDELLELRGHLSTVIKRYENVIQYDEDYNQIPELIIDWSKNTIGVMFNGKAGEGYETFLFYGKSYDFNFCKTARRPYDQAVCECLLLLEHYLKIDLRSDGFSNSVLTGKYKVGDIVSQEDVKGTWANAVVEVNDMLGSNYYFVVDEVRSSSSFEIDYISYKLKNG